MQKRLLQWYEKNGRHELPWRNTTNIYHIYLSEIMLQQTQVNRVRDEYYPQFLAKFPTLKTLADAQESEVLAAWSGLGYYSRARNLHKTAKLCENELPKSYEELLKLPGIGSYTASAICAFGYHQNLPVLDTNIKRVIKRLFALINPSEKELTRQAVKVLNDKEPRAHNLALMDLGSLVCLPKNPKCQECPLTSECQGKEEPELYTQTKKTKYETMELFYGVCVKDDKITLVKTEGSMYKGMLSLPCVDPLEDDFLVSFKHAYTKYRLSVHLYRLDEAPKDAIWLSLEELESAPISSLVTKALTALNLKKLP
ncbi:A/G-specific adenine glycosylase [Sulfurimonas indica]|uniref:A/G-specific adenine glycosylase n=1 Tax=Sulfurimonas indica TaxID=2508707 RepID=UPI001263EE85|nr:A/G-specific adenine glycosylase [Sulfurimonas indica]